MILPVNLSHRLNVLDFGADHRGGEDSSRAFNLAIEEASQKRSVVYVPPGRYLMKAPIILKSNVVIFIERDALIEFAPEYYNYPVVETRREGIHQCQASPLIFGENLRNIAIVGEGAIDGRGERWWYIKRSRVTEELWKKNCRVGRRLCRRGDKRPGGPLRGPTRALGYTKSTCLRAVKPPRDVCENYREFFRPQMLQLVNSENITIYGLTFRNSPMWNLHMLYSKHITIEKVAILAPDYSPNTDGIAIDSSSDVFIRGCLIDVGDDCVVLKSGKNEEGRKIGIPTTNVFVLNSVMKHGHGGIVIGSEMSGSVRNVSIENSVFDGTERGIRIKTARGRGGVVENVIARNIVMRDIVDEAIVIDMFYEPVPPEPVSERTPVVRRVYIQNITCYRSRAGY